MSIANHAEFNTSNNIIWQYKFYHVLSKCEQIKSNSPTTNTSISLYSWYYRAVA